MFLRRRFYDDRRARRRMARAAVVGLSLAAPTLAGAAVTVDAGSFGCITDMTPVRGFYVSNLLGDRDATLAVANSPDGGTYPPGSVVQLVPTEAMVKHEAGYSPATGDWEFFELDVSDTGTAVRKRGFADVVNRFGGNCFACHVRAEAKWDKICETGHGCDPIPLTRAMVQVLQKSDPRCKPAARLSPEEQTLLDSLQAAARAASRQPIQ